MGIGYTVPHIVTQKDFNQALIDLALSPDVYNAEDEDNASKTWVESYVAENVMLLSTITCITMRLQLM